MLRTTLLLAVILACATARPKVAYNQVPAVQPAVIAVPNPHAAGTSGSQLTKSETVLPGGGTTSVVQQGSNTGGQASGGGFNVGSSSSDSQTLQTAFGTDTKSNTNAVSQQGSNPVFPGFPTGGQFVGHQGLNVHPYPVGQGTHANLALPNFRVFPSPHAQGTSGSQLINSETVLPGGGHTNVVQQGSNTGGQASGGGFNVGSASSDRETLQTQHGSSTKSDTQTSSIQGANPVGPVAFPSPVFPAGQQYTGQLGCNPAFGNAAVSGIQGPGIPHAQGTSGSQLTKSETVLPSGGTTSVVQQGSSTGGQASGGGFNVGSASSDSQTLQTAHGSSTKSDTQASSIQGANPGAVPVAVPAGQQFLSQPGCNPGFGYRGYGNPGIGGPALAGLQGFGNPRAQGNSGSQVTQSQTSNPFGGTTNVVQQGSSTGGQASGGGFNVGSASSNTETLQTPHGTSTKSNTDADSQQGSNPMLTGFGGRLQLPNYPGQAGFGHGFQHGLHGGFNPALANAQGTSGSNIVNSETVNPFGGTDSVAKLTSGTGGQATGGGFNTGRASGHTHGLQTPHGASQTSGTSADSRQGAGVFGPASWPWPPNAGLGFGSATGQADSGLTEAKTTGADGSRTTVTQLGSSAGGSASDGGTNVSKSSGQTSSVTGAGGTQTHSHVDSESTQTGR